MTLSVYQDGMDDTYVTTWAPDKDSALIQYASLTTTGSLLTHSGDEQEGDSFRTPISNIAISVRSESNVPEPSMFGVFAGLGALGLVATRRRRNRKA
ncbi:MAG: PEP-CTERM sorting domain-containing protein [Opitutae bacterium]|nr:PEP-CTERM sorting domain-containing protein [Opitutae bacterium]